MGWAGLGRHSGWVWWYIGLGVGLKLIALWLATLCKIGGMQCSELLKEFRNSFCFLPAALDFQQTFFTRSFFVRTAKCCELLLNFAFCMRYVGFLAARPLRCMLPAISLPTLFPYAALLHAFLALCFWQFVLHCRRQRKSQ